MPFFELLLITLKSSSSGATVPELNVLSDFAGIPFETTGLLKTLSCRIAGQPLSPFESVGPLRTLSCRDCWKEFSALL